MPFHDYCRPINTQRLPTYLYDNKLYIATHPEDDLKRTHWHFINVDIILPNMFDFDIHNYVDEVIEYDRRRIVSNIISNKTIRISTMLSYSNYDIHCYHSSSYVTNYTFINDDAIIFYLLRPIKNHNEIIYKLSSIKIPKYMIQNEVAAAISRDDDKMFLKFFDSDRNASDIMLKRLDMTFDIDLGNFDDTSRYIIDNADLIKYQKLYLQDI